MSLYKSLALVSLALLVACGGGEETKPAEPVTPKVEEPKPAEPVVQAPAAPANAGPKGTNVINPDDASAAAELAVSTKGDELAYDVAELSAKAGENIRIKFANKAAAAGMTHNVVVVKAADVDAVANAGLAAGDANSYVPNDDAKVIGASAQVQPGGDTTLLIKGLEAGDYVIFCSFPGHYMTMQIKLKVA